MGDGIVQPTGQLRFDGRTVIITGAWRTTQAAWKHMLSRQYGRIVFTSSAAGLYGNFGQANYSAAKLGLVSMMRTLAREGTARNICSNAIAPLAATRFTSAVTPGDLAAKLRPVQVVPLVVVLNHDGTTENGSVLEVGAGWLARLRFAPERELGDFDTGADYPDAVEDTLRKALGQ